ncbi:DUF3606 domain-containing protein [Rugamonas aquatica]|uniref:DUF3606 domain-containing protein n=1 Tax=Rugamonas aquatica TaxID=2743357 RepID=A0A6A7N791_9BURK|nr:DUF3606 domain-containing protein [Rugamonas aquatica]MQA40953.1 DUF3606 domain-containing protein [Rugamonas aquatica]
MQVHLPVGPAPWRQLRTINPRQVSEIQYWAAEFDVTPATLVGVVREVGRNLDEIRKRLSA